MVIQYCVQPVKDSRHSGLFHVCEKEQCDGMGFVPLAPSLCGTALFEGLIAWLTW